MTWEIPLGLAQVVKGWDGERKVPILNLCNNIILLCDICKSNRCKIIIIIIIIMTWEN